MQTFLIKSNLKTLVVGDRATILKTTTAQAIVLPENQKYHLKPHTRLEVTEYIDMGTHLKVTLVKPLNKRIDWCVYKKHITLFGSDGLKIVGEYQKGDRLPKAVNLPVPHLSQLDNNCYPYGSCNVTSVAMCLLFYDLATTNRQNQLEDRLIGELKEKGLSRHWHSHLVTLMARYGLKSIFDVNTSWVDIKRSIANKNPVIISGKFSPSGHILVVRGYDENGFIVNDPYGEWYPWQNRSNCGWYDTRKSGENLHYSLNAMVKAGYNGTKGTWAHIFT